MCKHLIAVEFGNGYYYMIMGYNLGLNLRLTRIMEHRNGSRRYYVIVDVCSGTCPISLVSLEQHGPKIPKP